MGMIDDAKRRVSNEQAKAEQQAVWKAAGADESDLVALELTKEEKVLVDEFIDAVPDYCWNHESCSQRINYGKRDALMDEWKRVYHGFYRKYKAPDNTIRLCSKASYEKVEPWGQLYEPRRIPEIGSQKSVKLPFLHKFRCATIFEDGTVFLDDIHARDGLLDKENYIDCLSKMIKNHK